MSKKVLSLALLVFAISCGSIKKEESRHQKAALKAEAEKSSINKKSGQIVFFEFDSFTLNPDAKEIIDNKVISVLKDSSNSKIKVEGHCDERGSVSYNITLGKKRAESVKSYLVKNGIKSSRIKTISYGKSRPLDYGHNEEAWAKNRRAVTISIKK